MKTNTERCHNSFVPSFKIVVTRESDFDRSVTVYNKKGEFIYSYCYDDEDSIIGESVLAREISFLLASLFPSIEKIEIVD